MAMQRAFLLLAAMLLFSPAALAQSADWQKTWDETLAAAKKEGKVVLNAPPDQEVRQALPAAFKARFGITLEYISARGTDTGAKLRAERMPESTRQTRCSPAATPSSRSCSGRRCSRR